MKDKIIKALLILFIIIHASCPIVKLAILGYNDLTAILQDVYANGLIVVLCSAVLRLYNSNK